MWIAVYAPKGTSPEVIAKMSASVEQAMQDEKLLESYRLMGMSPDFENAAQLMERQKKEYLMWQDIVEKGKVQAD